MSWRLVAGVTAGWRLAPMTCSDRTVILKWTGPWWTPESSTPRYHQHSGDSRKSPGVGRLDPRLGERASDAVAGRLQSVSAFPLTRALRYLVGLREKRAH